MMQNDDDLDKTMIIPNPGGHRANSRNQSSQASSDKTLIADFKRGSQQPIRNAVRAEFSSSDNHCITGENIILYCARDILNLTANLRTLTLSGSIEQLRVDIEKLFNTFAQSMVSSSIGGVSKEVALSARYLLCCLVDELILMTPWGAQSPWAQKTLLSKLHHETSGGEKFFLFINTLLQQPSRNIQLIELCYVCLSMGFRGQYRVKENGELAVQQICSALYQSIEKHRPTPAELSPDWKIANNNNTLLKSGISPYFIFTVCCFVMVCTYVALLSNLSAHSNTALSKIEMLGVGQNTDTVSSKNTGKQAILAAEKIENLLSHAVAKGHITVHVVQNRIVIRLVSPTLFPVGSVDVDQAVLPDPSMLSRVILSFTDSIEIVGHTDSSGRAESNWAISRKRAEAIQAWLQTASPRIAQTITRGMASTQPIVTSPRAVENRRVELIFSLTKAESQTATEAGNQEGGFSL